MSHKYHRVSDTTSKGEGRARSSSLTVKTHKKKNKYLAAALATWLCHGGVFFRHSVCFQDNVKPACRQLSPVVHSWNMRKQAYCVLPCCRNLCVVKMKVSTALAKFLIYLTAL